MKVTIKKGNKTALVFGASGLVGGFCLHNLLISPNYEKVISFGRKELPVQNDKLEQYIIDFDRLEDYKELIQGNDLYCSLGTTIKKAGSKAAFRKIDFEIPKQIAHIAFENGVSQFILVSAADANASSKIFYNRVKGELEDEIRALNFWGTHILRPSILLGERKEVRPLERVGMILGQGIDAILGNLLGRYQPIKAEDVAKAMIEAAQKLEKGTYKYYSDQLKELGNGKRKLIE